MELKGLDELVRALTSLPERQRAHTLRGLDRAGRIVHRRSIRYAPRSPTSSQMQAVRKTTRDTSRMRSARAVSRPKPGGLERSIEYRVDKKNLSASVFVARNSEAGVYAARIHDERGVSWRNLGIGSRAKGTDVGEKFIERARADSEEEVKTAIADELEKVKW